MAVLTHVTRLHVGRVLACSVGTVMAAEAIARDVDVIEIRRQPGDRGMTIIAIVATRNVRRVLARGCDAIVAGTAGAGNLRMVDEVGRRPYVRVVTVFANVRRLNVCQVLAGSFRAIVAADTVARDVYMVEIGGPPGDRGVTVVARVATGDVRRVLAGCCEAVVAGAADAHNLGVVNGKHGHKHVSVVAVFADITCLYMRQILAGSVGAIVTVDAVTRDIHMIEIRRQPACCRVTVVARVTTGNVRRVLAACYEAVMT